MGRPYLIPRNYRGENKILFIFSMKSFLFTVGGAAIGLPLYLVLKIFKKSTIGLILILILGLIGFAIGTFKIPDSTNWEFTRKVGGESIDNIFFFCFKFKQKKNKIYIYKEEREDDK